MSTDVSHLNFTPAEQAAWYSLTDMHGGRQQFLNDLRWDLFLKMGIPLAGKTVFEPGAGIGDQTEWLLAHGAAHVTVNDGREANLSIIRKRLGADPRVTCLLGNIEDCLDRPEFQAIKADLVYLWGVYYHMWDAPPEFRMLGQLAQRAPTIVLEYLESRESYDWIETYGYDNPSTSISRRSLRPTAATMIAALKKHYAYAYWPKEQITWPDPCAPQTPRRLVVASHVPLDSAGLIAA